MYGYQVSHEDVTERKKDHQDVLQVMSSARCLLWQADVSLVGKKLHWTLKLRNEDAAQRLFQVAVPIGESYINGFDRAKHPDDLEEMHALSTRSIFSGASGYSQEYRVTLASMEVRQVYENVRIEPLLPGNWRVTGVCTDISDLKQAQQALWTSEHEFSNTFDNSAIGMAFVDTEGKWLRVNQALCVLLGYSNEELLEMTFLSVTHPDDLLENVKGRDLLRLGKIPFYKAEKRYVHKDGHVVWTLLGVSLILDADNRPVKLLAQIQDISEMKAAQEALQEANSSLESRVARRTAELVVANGEMTTAIELAKAANMAKSDFLSRVSHELRTPLNSILGFGQLLERQVPAGRQTESLNYIMKAGRHLLQLINEVLDVSRVESGNLEISLEAVELNEALAEACSLVEPVAIQREVTVTAQMELLPLLYARADRQRLRQVMINLLSNAIKYNHFGGRVEVSTSIVTGNRARISVRDWGPGIPAADLPKLFTPFERLGAAKSGVEGTGLGLVLSQQLTKAMGGKLCFETESADGCTFWFELDIAPDPMKLEGDLLQHIERMPQPLASLKVKKVLCIEDNESNVRLLDLIFQTRPDFKMISAMQGACGIQMAIELHPDVVLLDMNLPDMSGKDVLDALQMHPATKNLPVIILSADAIPTQMKRLIAAGAKAYLTKPLSVLDLLANIDKVLADMDAL